MIGNLCKLVSITRHSFEIKKRYLWGQISVVDVWRHFHHAPHLVEFPLRPVTFVGDSACSYHSIIAVDCTVNDQRKTLHLMFAQKNSPKAIQIEFTLQKQCILVDHSHKDSMTSRPMFTMAHIRRNPILHGYVAQLVLLGINRSMVPGTQLSFITQVGSSCEIP